MKRIEFIAPVEAIRGNMSGRQDLRYAENDNKAYEAPALKRNYARNYTPRFIGAKVSATGKKYFTVKTKVCTHVTTKWKKAAALLGGAGVIFASIVRDKTAAIYTGLVAQYDALVELGMKKTFRQYVMDGLRTGLDAKLGNITFAGPVSPVNVDNPWVKQAASLNVSISNEVLVKFWEQLAWDPIFFSVEGMTGVAHDGDPFTDVIENKYNVLNLTASGEENVQYNGHAISLDGETAIAKSASVTENAQYTLLQ